AIASEGFGSGGHFLGLLGHDDPADGRTKRGAAGTVRPAPLTANGNGDGRPAPHDTPGGLRSRRARSASRRHPRRPSPPRLPRRPAALPAGSPCTVFAGSVDQRTTVASEAASRRRPVAAPSRGAPLSAGRNGSGVASQVTHGEDHWWPALAGGDLLPVAREWARVPRTAALPTGGGGGL